MHNPVLKTFFFLAILTAILVGVGYLIGGPRGGTIFLVISVIMNLGAYWFSEKIALKMSKAKPLPESQAKELYSDLQYLTKMMDIPMPDVYYTEQRQANAFATGRNPAHSSICFTKGLLEILSRDEIRAVASHELAHIKNRDVLISTIAAVIAGAIAAIGDAIFWFGLGRNKNSGPFGIIAILIAPIAAGLVQMAISRQREFSADETGSHVTKLPMSLASALEKIHKSTIQNPMRINSALSTLYIENPLKNNFLAKLFSTHPPLEERIDRLRKLI